MSRDALRELVNEWMGHSVVNTETISSSDVGRAAAYYDCATSLEDYLEASPPAAVAVTDAMYGDLEATLRSRITDDGMHGSYPDELAIQAADAIANLRVALASQIEITNIERALADPYETLADGRRVKKQKHCDKCGHFYREHCRCAALTTSSAQSAGGLDHA
jgi:hypothetical protein